MKFEIQTTNEIFRNDGTVVEPLGRKYGPSDFLVKGSTGVRLESETHGVLEFETNWFRKWPELKEQIEEAAAMTQKMNDAPDVAGGRKAFPFNVDHLRKGTRRELKKGTWTRKKGYEGSKEKILGKGEELEVKIKDSSWNSGIQSSESFLLEQYESYLREHEWPEFVEPVIKSADDILAAANTKSIPAAELVNLRSFLQIIINYIKRGQGKPGGGGSKEFWKGAFANVEGMPAKQAFVLMSRTDFSSMYRSPLSKKEKAFFKKIVSKDVILDQMGLDRKSRFFVKGYGTDAHHVGPTVHQWLAGIYKGKDLLKGLSGAMGRQGVERRKGKKDTGLVKFETRNTVKGAWKKAADWMDYAKALFWEAATNRPRDEGKGGTGLKRT